MMRYLLIYICIAVVTCSTETANEKQVATEEAEISKESEQKKPNKDSLKYKNASTANSQEDKSEPVVYDKLNLPVRPKSGIDILSLGQYHNDEVQPDAPEKKWMGLFRNEGAYYLKTASVIFERVKDVMLDNEGEMTGWMISTKNPDPCILLIAEGDFQEGSVPSIGIENKRPVPGDTIDIKISSTMAKLIISGAKNSYMMYNYKMSIQSVIDGENINQIIVAKASFDDQEINIIWAGDLDGDEMVDLIIDTSRHYNASNPTLFLSSKAKPGSILECVAMHRRVGC